MGVEHVEVIGPGAASPTPGHRVPLGLTPLQKAKLKGAYFTFRDLGAGSARVEAALSEDLRVLTAGLVSPYLDSRAAFFYRQFLITAVTAVGIILAEATFHAALYDFEVYQDIVWVAGTSAGVQRLDLFYEKVRISKLEKATHLSQLERHFAAA